MYNTSYAVTYSATNPDGTTTAPAATGNSGLKALFANATDAFGTCAQYPPPYCGADSNIVPGPQFTAGRHPVTAGTEELPGAGPPVAWTTETRPPRRPAPTSGCTSSSERLHVDPVVPEPGVGHRRAAPRGKVLKGKAAGGRERRSREAQAFDPARPPAVPGVSDLRLIGGGGNATVYQGTEAAMRRKVAVKVFHTPLRDAEGRQAFERECANAGRVGQHPNAANVYTSGFDGDRPYIVMQYYARGSLADRLAGGPPFGVAEVLTAGVQIAAALQFAHNLGICHRDVKPENILCDAFGDPVLTDFGIATDRDAATMTLHHAMTAAYAAPEVLRYGGGWPVSDVWSLAAALYALLAGYPPFWDGTSPTRRPTCRPSPARRGRSAVPTCPPTCRKRWPARSPGGTTTAPCRLAAWPRNCRRTRPGSASADPDPRRPRPRPGPDRRPGRPAPDHAAPIRRGASRVHPHHGRWHPDPRGAPATDGGGGFATGNGPAGYGTGSVTTDGPQARHYAAPPTGRLDTGDAYRAPQASQGQARRRLPRALIAAGVVVILAVAGLAYALVRPRPAPGSAGAASAGPGPQAHGSSPSAAAHAAVPSPPAKVKAVAAGPTSARISWRNTMPRAQYTQVAISLGSGYKLLFYPNDSPQVVTGLSADQPYCFAVGYIYGTTAKPKVAYSVPACINGGVPSAAGQG